MGTNMFQYIKKEEVTRPMEYLYLFKFECIELEQKYLNKYFMLFERIQLGIYLYQLFCSIINRCNFEYTI